MFLFVKLHMQSLKLFIHCKNTKRLCLGRVNGESLFGVIIFQGAWVEEQNRPSRGAGGWSALQPPCPYAASVAPACGILPAGLSWWLTGLESSRAGCVPSILLRSLLPQRWFLRSFRERLLTVAKSCVGLLAFSFFFLLGVELSDQSFKRQKVFQRDRLTVKSWGPFCWFVSSESNRFAGQLLLLSDLHDWLTLLWGETHLLKKTLLNRYSS